ncbi:MAG: UDP-3-O-(3-hydroxymyristoyl)glucosamine N-acyltransferase [Desulfobulbus sp.]|nr:UDP-3-O-(3-hydroxymyristoyl)glucosamine N-acyltransferase [Desulfobulbus sp.]
MFREYTLRQLAELVNGQVEGDPDLVIHALNGIEYAQPGEITFVLDDKHLPLPEQCRASACIVPAGASPLPIPVIVAEQPAVAAARIHALLLAEPFQAQGIHPSAVLGAGCVMLGEVTVGPLVALGDRVTLGERVVIHAGAVIGSDTVIGDDTVIHANVTVAERCTIGRRVVLHHGAVIGSDGFGFASDHRGVHYKKPQVGTVRIDDDVEVGANACVDRAAFGVTWIKSGTKIDNLVMIGHNVVIGENSMLVAQVGIAGSTTLGRNVVLGAKAGVAGHLHLGDQVMAAAKSGIHNNQPKGAMVGGTPAIEVRDWARASAAFGKLPEMVKELRRLRKEVDRLSSLLAPTQHEEKNDDISV